MPSRRAAAQLLTSPSRTAGRSSGAGASRLPPPLAWETDVPLLTNWVVLGSVLKAFGITGVLIAALFSLMAAVAGRWDTIPSDIMMAGAIVVGLVVLGLLGALLVYGNRMTMRFRLDDKGIDTAVIDRRSNAVSALLVLFAALAGRPGAMGTGILAATGKRQSATWKRISAARFRPRWRTVTLFDGWHTAAVLFCRPDNYEAVADRVRTEMAKHADKPNIRTTKRSAPSNA